jgi:hypothetical protein
MLITPSSASKSILINPHGPLETLTAISAVKLLRPCASPRYSDRLPIEHVPAPGFDGVPVSGGSETGRIDMPPSTAEGTGVADEAGSVTIPVPVGRYSRILALPGTG